ncbi:MAG: hypothetical protein CMN30_10890 [Sandaracinus sp.]|nr:hypothetical protein [Sandaracinus sp.]
MAQADGPVVEPDADMEGAPQQVSLDDAEARALFEAGLLAFQNTRFEDALQRFTRAYELSGRVELLFNVGITADRLRRDEQAIEAFEGYLGSDPVGENRRHAEARLAFLREQVAARAPIEAEPEAEVAEPVAPAPVASTAAVVVPEAEGEREPAEGAGAGPWVLGGVGVGVAVVGAVLLGVAAGASNAVTDPDDGALWADLEGDADRGPVFEGLGWAAIGVGLASVAGAIVWLVVGQPDEDDSVAFTGNGFRTRWGTL